MIKIDKSAFSAEELAQYEALIAKATVDPEAEEEEEEVEGELPPVKAKKTEEVGKSASPELEAAMAELADLRKSFEMKEMTQVAKKYAPLGKKEDELAQTLYEMKKSNEANYNAFIAVLDESLGVVEKSGIFTEIGKSASGSGSLSGAEAKADAKAKEIMKSDASIDYTTAIAKAWEDPEIMAEYDAEYGN